MYTALRDYEAECRVRFGELVTPWPSKLFELVWLRGKRRT
jgi:hypothetical protein